MTTYTIKPGQWNFRPLESWRPRFVVRGFSGWAKFDESAWFDWEGDRDARDWNKLKGLTRYIGANNHHSAIIAWRPAEERGVFEVAAYTNYPGARWIVGELVKAKAGEKVHFEAVIYKRKVQYKIQSSLTGHDFRRCTIMREIGTSIGGANNSPGEYGGKATQEMKIEVEMKIH